MSSGINFNDSEFQIADRCTWFTLYVDSTLRELFT